jgi:anti-sigma28 factor (negative regulator of flagellin synthesis)
MKISNHLPNPVLCRVKKNHPAERARAVQPVPIRDEDSNPSGWAQDLVKLLSQSDAVPEAESRKVDAIRRAVAESRYLVSSELLAERLLSRLTEYRALSR